MATDEKDIVLDPFSGTGTTAIAAKRLGRQYIGFEMDSQYVSIAENKLRQEESNSRIGSVWVSSFIGEVTTIRDVDWAKLSKEYILPEQARDIDHTPIVLKTAKLISYTPKPNGNHDNGMTRLFEEKAKYKKESKFRVQARNKQRK